MKYIIKLLIHLMEPLLLLETIFKQTYSNFKVKQKKKKEWKDKKKRLMMTKRLFVFYFFFRKIKLVLKRALIFRENISWENNFPTTVVKVCSFIENFTKKPCVKNLQRYIMKRKKRKGKARIIFSFFRFKY